MRPPWLRIPWQELWVEITVVIGFTILNISLAWVGEFEPVYVSLIAFGSLALALWAIGNYERIREPFRRRVPSDHETLKAIDEWLGDNDYARGPVQLPLALGTGYYERALEVSYAGGVKVWIAVEQRRKLLVFLSQRGDPIGEIARMDTQEAAKMKFDLALEVLRIGALHQTAENPYTLTFGDTLPIDETLTAAKVLEKVIFIQQVDNLVMNLYAKYFIGVGEPGSDDEALTAAPSSQSPPGTESSQP